MIEARWWREAGGGAVEAAAVQDSEQVRAHNQERTFPAKPDCETSSRHGVWLRGAVPAHDNDDALCSRTNETRKWGVSDPDGVPPHAVRLRVVSTRRVGHWMITAAPATQV